MLRRAILPSVSAALSDRPVVFLSGPRQSGKTTLAQTLVARGELDALLTLDHIGTLAAAREDPVGFVAGLPPRAGIDEIQRAPDLLLAIKAEVDRSRSKRRFLLTGSADVLVVPTVSESLVGRMEIVRLGPLSQGEIEGTADGFVESVFDGSFDPTAIPQEGDDGPIERIVRGGFPELVTSIRPERRAAWFESYLTSLVERDVRDLANVQDLAALPRLVSLAAARTATLLNHAELARASGLPLTTLRRYLTLLEAAFLMYELPAWHTNIGKRLVRSPRLMMTDSGIGAHLQGMDGVRLRGDRTALGPLLETFAAGEIRKQLAWSRRPVQLFHYRTHQGEEVDLVLEDRAGRLVGVEVKATATLGHDATRGLRALAAAAPGKFVRGVVLYTGAGAVPLAANLHALPISSLWRLGAVSLGPPEATPS